MHQGYEILQNKTAKQNESAEKLSIRQVDFSSMLKNSFKTFFGAIKRNCF